MERRSKHAAIIGIVILLLLILRGAHLLDPVEDVLQWALSPVARILSVVGSDVPVGSERYPDIAACESHVQDLERQLQNISVDYVQLRALEEENETLRKTLQYVQEKEYDAVMGHVISRSVVPSVSTFMIDRGATDGLEVGMAVMVEDGLYVGKIYSIRDRTSIVLLTPDPRSRVAISQPGTHTLIGLVEGRGNNVAEATLVPQRERLEVDDLLVTAGTEEKVPADLVVGIVNRIFGEATDPFKSAAIQPLVSPERLKVVAVLRPRVLRPEDEAL